MLCEFQCQINLGRPTCTPHFVELRWTCGIEVGSNRNLLPTFPFDVFTHQKPIFSVSPKPIFVCFRYDKTSIYPVDMVYIFRYINLSGMDGPATLVPAARYYIARRNLVDTLTVLGEMLKPCHLYSYGNGVCVSLRLKEIYIASKRCKIGIRRVKKSTRNVANISIGTIFGPLSPP